MNTKNWMSAVLIIAVALTTNAAFADQNLEVSATASADTSFATQIAHAGNLTTMQDYEVAPQAISDQDSRSATSRSLDLVMAGGTASGVFTSGAVSPGMGASLWLVSALLPTRKIVKDEAVTRLFVWMPRELANDEQMATQLMIEYYESAVKNALPGHEVQRVESSVSNGGRGGVSLKVTGALCPESCIQTIFYINQPEVGQAPEILGGYDAYVWKIRSEKRKSNFIPQGRNFFPLSEKSLTKEDRVDFYQRLSANLPEWAYLYVAPNKKASPVPVMFNSGIANYFIKPEKSPNLVSN